MDLFSVPTYVIVFWVVCVFSWGRDIVRTVVDGALHSGTVVFTLNRATVKFGASLCYNTKLRGAVKCLL